MGVVYEVEDISTHARAALKLMHIPQGASPEHISELTARMLREATIASQVKHPNITQVYASGTQEGIPYIVMELCLGTTLRDYLGFEKIIPPPKVKEITLRILSALEAAHSIGIVHRDIKPENIMMTRDGSIKLMDFGIAKLETDSRVTHGGEMLGTPAYMSPEQILGHTVDHRADLFSLGAVLYECLAGEKAFPGDTATAVINQITQSNPVMLQHLPEAWAGIIWKALMKDPDMRYQSAVQMSDDVLQERAPGVDQAISVPTPQQAGAPVSINVSTQTKIPSISPDRLPPYERNYSPFLDRLLNEPIQTSRGVAYGSTLITLITWFFVLLLIVVKSPHHIYYINGHSHSSYNSGFSTPWVVGGILIGLTITVTIQYIKWKYTRDSWLDQG